MSLIKNLLKIILKINMSKEEVNIKFVREIKKRSVIWDAYSIDNKIKYYQEKGCMERNQHHSKNQRYGSLF